MKEYGPDMKLAIGGWIKFLDFVCGVVYIIGLVCSLVARDLVWSIVFLVLLSAHQIAYKIVVAIFEIIKHLRQIRDELKIINATEGKGE